MAVVRSVTSAVVIAPCSGASAALDCTSPVAISAAMACVPSICMRSSDTSLPHSFQVVLALSICACHQPRWVSPRIDTGVSAPAAAVIFCASRPASVAFGTK
ncbi:hypothetical protein D3C81_2092480 [compost metagenome]